MNTQIKILAVGFGKFRPSDVGPLGRQRVSFVLDSKTLTSAKKLPGPDGYLLVCAAADNSVKFRLSLWAKQSGCTLTYVPSIRDLDEVLTGIFKAMADQPHVESITRKVVKPLPEDADTIIDRMKDVETNPKSLLGFVQRRLNEGDHRDWFRTSMRITEYLLSNGYKVSPADVQRMLGRLKELAHVRS